MEEKDKPTARRFGYAVYAFIVLIPMLVVRGSSGSWLGALATGVVVVLLLVMGEWGGGVRNRLPDRSRDEAAPYDEPPDRPLSRW